MSLLNSRTEHQRTVLWSVLIFHPVEVRKLSWPGWLVLVRHWSMGGWLSFTETNVTTLYPSTTRVSSSHKMQSKTTDFAPGAAIWRTRRNMRVVCNFAHSLYYVKTKLWTKPELHNTPHCRQRRTAPQTQLACPGNLVKFGRVLIEICQQTDRHTDRNTLHTYIPGRSNIHLYTPKKR